MSSLSPLRWSDLRGTSIGVWGVGVEGRATLDRLDDLGIVPRAIVDDAPRSDEVLATDSGGIEALTGCDVVVKSPGISRYSEGAEALVSAGVSLVGGLGLWLEEIGSGRVIGVTGTKGKSTTVAVAGHLARGLGQRCAVGGNLGIVPWARDAPTDADLWVIEVSSYQATDLWSSPAVAAVTSLHPDHLNWHGDVDTYVQDKLSLCGRPGATITVANGDDPWLRDRSEMLRPGPRWVTAESFSADWTAPLGLRGRHNVRNAYIAAACLQEMSVPGADDAERLGQAAQGYESLPHRLETVDVVGGIEYVDDSLSTNVLPTIVAAEVFDGRPLALLVGGYDRQIDYTPLATFARERDAPTVVLTLPQNGDRIREVMEAASVDVESCSDVAEAVRKASERIASGGVVLLSPAAASYGIYRDYRQRAEAFRRAVAGLSGP
jgi:UDP-N-acetylmuramoylalanine--D-glutamate ligase